MRHGTPPASRDVPGERGRLSSCIWNLGFFPNDARKNCPFVLTAFTGGSSERCPGIGFLSSGAREIGVLRNMEPPTRLRLECLRGRSEEHTSELHPVNEVNTKGQFFRASFGKKPQVPKTARQAASLPGDISRGKRSSMPQPKTRPDSPVPSLQGPCDRSLKSEVPCGSCLNWR